MVGSRILDYLREHMCATCDDLEIALDIPHQTVSARICEMLKKGTLGITPSKKPTRHGGLARVYRINEETAKTA